MGDVTGHGLPSALLRTAGLRRGLLGGVHHGMLGAREAAPAAEQPAAQPRRRVNPHRPADGKGELLMTMAFMNVHLRTGQGRFQRGHNMPYLVKGGGTARPEPTSTTVSNIVSRGSRLGEGPSPEFEVVHHQARGRRRHRPLHRRSDENQGPDGKRLLGARHEAGAGSQTQAGEIRDEVVARAPGSWKGPPAADDHSLLVFRVLPRRTPTPDRAAR
jgi:hypothetical protein